MAFTVSNCPELKHLNVFQITGFVATCQHMLPSIKQGWREQVHDSSLPTNILLFLKEHLKMNFNDIEACWRLLHDEITNESFADFRHIAAIPYATTENIKRLWSFE